MLAINRALNSQNQAIDLDSDDDDKFETKNVCRSINKSLSKMTIKPNSRYKLVWDLVANTSYIIGFFTTSIALAFRLDQYL